MLFSRSFLLGCLGLAVASGAASSALGQAQFGARNQAQNAVTKQSAAANAATQSAMSNGKKTDGKTTEKEDVAKDAKRVKIGGIQWYVDYDTALKLAQEENKLMWLHFGENPG